MSAVITRVTLDDYMTLLKECFVHEHPDHAEHDWHPEDLWANLSVLMWPLTVGLTNGKKAIKLDDKFWTRTNTEDPL